MKQYTLLLEDKIRLMSMLSDYKVWMWMESLIQPWYDMFLVIIVIVMVQ